MTPEQIADEARTVFQIGLFVLICGAMLAACYKPRWPGFLFMGMSMWFFVICHAKGYWSYLP